MFEDDFILTQEKFFRQIRTVLSQFHHFLFWTNRLHLQDVHEVTYFVEQLVSITEHILQILKPSFGSPILA